MKTNLTETSSFFIGNKPVVLHMIHLQATNIAIYQRNIERLKDEIKYLVNNLNASRCDGSVASIIRQLAHTSAFAQTPKFLEDVNQILQVFEQVTTVKNFRLLIEVVKTDMCRKFHSDMNDLRLLCTYEGPGTQWLNKKQEYQLDLSDKNDLFSVPENYNQCSAGDVIILKGALYEKPDTHAVLHRSPSIEHSGGKRLLLRIDTNENVNFWS